MSDLAQQPHLLARPTRHRHRRGRLPRLLRGGEAAGARRAPLPPNSGGDLAQREAVLALLHDARPDLIIHLAARVAVRVRGWAAADD